MMLMNEILKSAFTEDLTIEVTLFNPHLASVDTEEQKEWRGIKTVARG
jgi:hypothetical protein